MSTESCTDLLRSNDLRDIQTSVVRLRKLELFENEIAGGIVVIIYLENNFCADRYFVSYYATI